MALKDWIFIGKKLGRSYNITEYMNTKNKNFITIVRYTSKDFRAIIRRGFGLLDEDVIVQEENFKSIRAALAFAKSYMRTH
jgi:hypothetical protein